MDRWKAEQGRGREKRKIRRKKSRRERVRRKQMPMREKVGKSRNTVFPQWFGGSGGSKSRLAKAAGAEPAGQMRDEKLHANVAQKHIWKSNVKNTSDSDHFWKLRCRKKCTPLWREAHFEVKMHKKNNSRTTFGSWDVEKVRAVVARSTFPSQNVQSTPAPDHFWQLRCWKSARRCGAKHISKSKCTKHHMLAPLFEVQMSFRVAGARDCAPLQKWAKREGFVAISKNDGKHGTFEEWMNGWIDRKMESLIVGWINKSNDSYMNRQVDR